MNKLDYEVYVVDKPDSKKGEQQVFISIRIPQKTIDEIASNHKLKSSLTDPNFSIFIETDFKLNQEKYFNAFDSKTRNEAIIEFLRLEIDFEYYSASGIIEQHFPLHKRNTIGDMQKSLWNIISRLKFGFLFGGFTKHMQPLN